MSHAFNKKACFKDVSDMSMADIMGTPDIAGSAWNLDMTRKDVKSHTKTIPGRVPGIQNLQVRNGELSGPGRPAP